MPGGLLEIIGGLLVQCGIILHESLSSGLWKKVYLPAHTMLLVRLDTNRLYSNIVVNAFLDETSDD